MSSRTRHDARPPATTTAATATAAATATTDAPPRPPATAPPATANAPVKAHAHAHAGADADALTPGQWLKASLKRRYASQAAFARAAGVPGQYISNWTTGKVALSLEYLPAVARALAVDVHVVAQNMHIPLPGLAPPMRTPEEMLAELEANVPVTVPVVQNVIASMGNGLPVEEFLYLPPLFRRTDRNRILAVVAEGQCMEPEIRTGDYVIFDKDAQWQVGDIVLAAVEGQMLVKRLARGKDYTLILQADATGDTISITEDAQIFGRVIWISRPL